jgi:hypothetical protein
MMAIRKFWVRRQPGHPCLRVFGSTFAAQCFSSSWRKVISIRLFQNDANTPHLYLKYWDEEHQSQAEKSFIRELATEMLRLQKNSLAIDDPTIAESLRREFEKDGRDSGYESLKEKGILRELE